jgi:uncharacterized membrane protein
MNFGSLFGEAKRSLKGKCLIVCVMVFIYMVVSEGLTWVDNVMSIKSIMDGTFFTTSETQPIWPTIIVTILQAFLVVGYATAMLNVARGKDVKLGDLLLNWRFGFKAMCLIILQGIYTVLWTLLFIVPGIVKAYSYSMALYILVEDPTKGINQCITESRELMNGYKFDLFVVELVFGALGLLSVGLMSIIVLVPVAVLGLNKQTGANGIAMTTVVVLGIIAFLIAVLLRTINEVVCAHFYLKISAKETVVRTFGDERFEDINKENIANNIIE